MEKQETLCVGGSVMDKVSGKLTIFFEEPFWVGVFERIENGKLSVAKCQKAGTGNRYWNKVAKSIEVTAGTEQTGAKGQKPGEKAGRRKEDV